MKSYQRLIAAIDFTPSCRNALCEAVRMGRHSGASITAVHVMDEFLVSELKRALSTDQASIRAEWETRLRKFVDDSELGTPHVEIEIRMGNAFQELVECCRVHQADLLVMGARGSRNEPNRVGVIAARCVRKAPVDVLLVREDAQGPFRHLVACVDLSENSARAVSHALQIAAEDGATLDCLHVYQSALAMSLDYGGLAAPVASTMDEQGLRMWQTELDKFLAPVEAAAPSVRVTRMVKERVNIREAILEHVTETQADMVVLGTRGKSGLRELLIGTTAEKIVAHATCSILAVKPSVLPEGDD